MGQGHMSPRAGSQLPPSCPTHGAQTAPFSRCASHPPASSCLLPASSSPRCGCVPAAGNRSPLDGVPQMLGGGDLVVVTSCSSLTPQDCGQDAGVTWWRQKEGASREGTGDSPAVSPALRRLCGAGWHSGHSAEMARLLLSPGSAAACVTLLLGCAWLGSAAQPSPGKCLGGSGGDRVGQGHLAGTPQYHVP